MDNRIMILLGLSIVGITMLNYCEFEVPLTKRTAIGITAFTPNTYYHAHQFVACRALQSCKSLPPIGWGTSCCKAVRKGFDKYIVEKQICKRGGIKMNVSFELIISLMALLISIYNLNGQREKCNKRSLVDYDRENNTSNKMSCFPCGKPKPIAVIASLVCAFTSALIVYGIRMIFIAIGLSFTINDYMYFFCFTSMFFTIVYCDSRYFRLHHSANIEKDLQNASRFVVILSVGILVLNVAVTLIMENAKIV